MDLVLHIGAHRTGSTIVEYSTAGAIVVKPEYWALRHARGIAGVRATMRTDGPATSKGVAYDLAGGSVPISNCDLSSSDHEVCMPAGRMRLKHSYMRSLRTLPTQLGVISTDTIAEARS